MMRRRLMIVGVAAAVSAVSLLAPSAAVAHGGSIQIIATADESGVVFASPVYEEDQHPVEDLVDLTASAVSEFGDEVGPVSLVSQPEGLGFWATEERLLPAGTWTVTVSMTSPAPAEVSFEAVIPDPSLVGAEAEGPVEVVEPLYPDWLPWVVPAASIVLIGLVAVLLVRRRRRISA